MTHLRLSYVNVEHGGRTDAGYSAYSGDGGIGGLQHHSSSHLGKYDPDRSLDVASRRQRYVNGGPYGDGAADSSDVRQVRVSAWVGRPGLLDGIPIVPHVSMVTCPNAAQIGSRWFRDDDSWDRHSPPPVPPRASCPRLPRLPPGPPSGT